MSRKRVHREERYTSESEEDMVDYKGSESGSDIDSEEEDVVVLTVRRKRTVVYE